VTNEECYIIIRVKPHGNRSAGNDAALIRRRLHELAKAYDMCVADNLIRSDRTFNPHTHAPEPITEARELFKKVFPIGYPF
jgi:hypothetical protein